MHRQTRSTAFRRWVWFGLRSSRAKASAKHARSRAFCDGKRCAADSPKPHPPTECSTPFNTRTAIFNPTAGIFTQPIYAPTRSRARARGLGESAAHLPPLKNTETSRVFCIHLSARGPEPRPRASVSVPDTVGNKNRASTRSGAMGRKQPFPVVIVENRLYPWIVRSLVSPCTVVLGSVARFRNERSSLSYEEVARNS